MYCKMISYNVNVQNENDCVEIGEVVDHNYLLKRETDNC